MLDFELDLDGAFIQNLKAFRAIYILIMRDRKSPDESLTILREVFKDLNSEQFLELLYEHHELHCVRFGKPRHSSHDINKSSKTRNMLKARNEESFYAPKFLQVMGRAMRMPSNPIDLIGKQVRVQIKRDKD